MFLRYLNYLFLSMLKKQLLNLLLYFFDLLGYVYTLLVPNNRLDQITDIKQQNIFG